MDPTETISSNEPLEPPGAERGNGRRSTGSRATALTAALTLVLAGGVATAAYRSSGSSSGPPNLIPSTAFAVATVDLGLSGGQDGALQQMLDRFPGAPTRSGSGSVRDRLLRALFSRASNSVDYDTDIKPWLGDHAAVAGWMDSGAPQLEVLLQSRDDTSAREHLTKLMHGDGAVVMSGGYAVLAQSAAKAHDAIAAAAKSSLADAGNYGADVGGLPDNEILTGWVDGPGVEQLLNRAFVTSPGGPGGMLPGLGMLGMGNLHDALRGRVAVGLRAATDYAQLDVRQIGGPQTATAPSTLLTDLPASTVGALELGDPGRVVDSLMGLVQMFGAFGAGTSCVGSVTAVPVPALPGSAHPAMPPPRMVVPLGTPHRRAILRELRHARAKALAAQRRAAHRRGQPAPPVGPGPTTLPLRPPPRFRCHSTSSPAPNPIDAIKKATGLTLPGDVKTLLGDGGVIAYGGLQFGGVPDVAIRSHPTDLAAAQTVAETLKSHLANSPGFTIAVQTAGDNLILATSDAYAAEIAKNGSLGDQDQVRTALGDVPGEVSVAGYVDLGRVWPLLGSAPAAVTHLKALGFWADSSGDVQHTQLRLVVS